MKNKKFKLLILSLKACLIIMIAISLYNGLSGFAAGWNDSNQDEPGSNNKLSPGKEIIAVIPVNDSVLFEGSDYSITGIRSFQVQERRFTEHSISYNTFNVSKLIISLGALIFLIKFVIKAFALLNQFGKFIILTKENLLLLSKVAQNLLIFGILINIYQIVRYTYSIKYFNLKGYKIDPFIEFDFSAIIIALIILTASWFVKFAIELKEENDLTI